MSAACSTCCCSSPCCGGSANKAAELARLAAIGPFGKAGYDVGKLIGKPWPAADVPALVGFFAPGCEPCHLEAPTFAAAAAGGGAALAVVSGDPSQAREVTELLGDAPSVLVGSDARRLIEALGVQGFPTFLRIDVGGTIRQAGTSMDDIAVPATV